jgi:hypothetical protein
MGGMHVLTEKKRYSQARKSVRRRVGTGLVERLTVACAVSQAKSRLNALAVLISGGSPMGVVFLFLLSLLFSVIPVLAESSI